MRSGQLLKWDGSDKARDRRRWSQTFIVLMFLLCADPTAIMGSAEDLGFDSAQCYEVRAYATPVVVGDFDGDGSQDLAVADYWTSTVSVLLGEGDGSFGTARLFDAVSPTSIAVGDFNGDAVQDLVVTNGAVSILLGEGDGSFGMEQSFYAGGNPSSVAVGDFDDDGWQDIAVANWDHPAGEVCILINQHLADEDGDGIGNDLDVCPGTVIPEPVPTLRMGINRWALVNEDGVFDSIAASGRGSGLEDEFTLEDTAGCSCAQIIERQHLGSGHEKYGCSTGVMEEWVRQLDGILLPVCGDGQIGYQEQCEADSDCESTVGDAECIDCRCVSHACDPQRLSPDCNEPRPTCNHLPAISVPEISDGCYTGRCIPWSECEPISCEDVWLDCPSGYLHCNPETQLCEDRMFNCDLTWLILDEGCKNGIDCPEGSYRSVVGGTCGPCVYPEYCHTLP